MLQVVRNALHRAQVANPGAAFRQADPHKHIHDLVLGDTSRMRDLHDTPMAEIIDLLAELGGRGEGQPRLLFQVRQGAAAIDPGPLLGLQN